MLSLAEDMSELVKESAIAMHPLLQKLSTFYKWLISGQGFDKEEFKEVCKKVQKPSEKSRVSSAQTQRSTGRSTRQYHGVKDQGIQRWKEAKCQ